MKFHSLILILILITAFSTGCSKPESSSTERETPEAPPEVGLVRLTDQQLENGNFQLTAAKVEEIGESFDALGEFRARAKGKAMVEASLEGRVDALLIEEGAFVQRGEPLMVLQSPELSRILADYHHAQRKLDLLQANSESKLLLTEQGPETQEPLNKAQIRLQQARAQVQAEEALLEEVSQRKERLEKLYQVGIPSLEQVEQVRAEYFQSLARYQAAQDEERAAQDVFRRESTLHRSQARESVAKREISSALDLAREEVRHQRELLEVLGKEADEEAPTLILKAPVTGLVSRISTSLGEYVRAGDSLLEIVRSEEIYPVAFVPDSQIPKVSVGTEAQVFLTEQGPGYEARVEWLAPQIDPNTRSLEARLSMKDQPSSARAGMFLKARLFAPQRKGLVVPLSAVTEVEGKACLYVAQDKNTFRRREVKLGVRSFDSVEVVNGLQPGEKCVSKDVFLLKSSDLGVKGE